jgi:hypothetical protein
MWSILAIVAGILIVFCGTCIYRAASWSHVPNLEETALSLTSLTSVPTSVKSIIEGVIGHSIITTSRFSTPSGLASMSSRISKILEPTTPADNDPLLRIFDDL